MKLCSPACENLTWNGDHYDGRPDQQGDVETTYTIVRWGATGVELSANFVRAGSRGMSVVGTLKATLPHDGTIVKDGVSTWRMKSGTMAEIPLPSRPFELSWQIAPPAPAETRKPPTAESGPATYKVQLTPDGLPVILYECDVEPSAKPCGVWHWTGKAFEGYWPNGAVGRMTVSGKPAALVIKRIDPQGSRAGLTATYTGKWDGKAVVGGKFTWFWDGKTANYEWTASSEMPKGCYLKVDIGSIHSGATDSSQYYTTNTYESPVSALAVLYAGYGGSGGQLIDYVLRGEAPQRKGERRDTGIHGTTMEVSQIVVLAVLFSDGEEWGVASAIDKLKARRKDMLEKLKTATPGQGEFANKTAADIDKIRAGILADAAQEGTFHAYLPEVIAQSSNGATTEAVPIQNTPQGTATGTVGVPVNEEVSAKLLKTKVAPVYSTLARSARTQGTVKLEFTVTPSGDVTDIKVLAGHPLLTDSATTALGQWKYNPYTVKGEPVAMRTTTEIKFELVGR